MILRLAIAVGALDAERRQILAQPRQRALVQEAGEIIGAVGQQLAAADADEQIEELALDLRDVVRLRPLRPGSTCATPSGVASPRSAASRSSSVASGARDSSAASSAYSCARARSTSSMPSADCRRRKDRAAESRGRRRSPLSTVSTRSAGTRVQLETEGWEMPIRRASSVTPPTARIASCSPRSGMVVFLCHSRSRDHLPGANKRFRIMKGYRRSEAAVNSLRL